MVTGEPTPKRISAAELDAVLDRARAEGWQELALVGPGRLDYAELANGVFEARTFFLKEALGPRIGKVASLGALTKLSIRGNGIGDEGVHELGRLTNLTWLSVGGNGIGTAGAQALGELRSLTALSVSGNGIGAEGARTLGALNHLTTLSVSGNGIGDEGARALGGLTNLTSLGVCLLYTSPSPRDRTRSRMPSSA